MPTTSRPFRRPAAAVLTALLLTTGSLTAHADNLVVDGDFVTAVDKNDALSLGQICEGESRSGNVLLGINRLGGNTFADGAVVTVSVDAEKTATSASITDASITLPSNWTGLPNNTLSLQTASSIVTVNTIGLAVSPTFYSQEVKYKASGDKKDGGTLSRPGTLTVSFAVIECSNPNGQPTVSEAALDTNGNEGDTLTTHGPSVTPTMTPSPSPKSAVKGK